MRLAIPHGQIRFLSSIVKNKMKRIVCYGDSNTWGFIPGTGERYDENTRWPALLQKALGDDYDVMEAGMNCRTTSFDDPTCDYLNGRRGMLYTLSIAKPIDLLIISLGTNDLKYTDARGSSKGLAALLNTVQAANYECFDGGCTQIFQGAPQILVISPITLHPGIGTRKPPSSLGAQYGESLQFRKYYEPICQSRGISFLDASLYASASEVDCIHMTPESHADLSVAISMSVRSILGRCKLKGDCL